MNKDDITLKLTAGTRLNTLQVYPEFSDYNELMQRAVVLLLTSDSNALKVNGYTLAQAVANSTSSGASALRSYTSSYADGLKNMLNADGVSVSSLSIDIELVGSVASVAINISTYDGAEISGEFTI